MKLIITLLLSVYSIIAISSSPVEKDQGVIKVHSLNPANKPLQESLEYKNARIVELGQTPLFMQVDKIKKLEMNDHLLFIQSSKNLYAYTHDGQLITQIGRKGEREDEYNELGTFYVDNSKKQITIIDYTENKMIHYDFWGSYLSTDTVPDGSFKWTYQTIATGDKKLLNYNGMSMDDTRPYSLLDLEKKEICGRYFSYYPVTVDNYVYPFSWHPMTRAGNDVDLILPLSDTIYTYSAATSSFQPKYLIETSQKMAPKEKIRKHTPSYSGDLSKLSQQGFFTGFNGIYETDADVLLEYESIAMGYFLFNKSSRTGNYYLYSGDNNDKTLPFYHITYSYKNEFVAYVDSGKLKSLTGIKDKKIKDKIKSLRYNSPCLIFYELK